MYGCEAWTLTQTEEKKLLITERKQNQRKILGPVQRPDGSWRLRKNAEIEEFPAIPNIIGKIKAHRLCWLGHVERMEEDRGVKRAYFPGDPGIAEVIQLRRIFGRFMPLTGEKWRRIGVYAAAL
ncbi:uncharacterized protein LOC113500489 [Trichoplusia ni]|uniref:Uncharacterized protein LOC113500489 n=1 Tax=Trichoplusia ni TaxID=7111 RepID=A0A7E5W9F8_TRINI|nr:uncharacterized protein LOC113500489 [Trichoplusia ni]